MTQEDKVTNRKYFREYRAELFDRERSNAESYDNNILKLSAVFLVFSLFFGDSLSGFEVFAWVSLASSMFAVLVSFPMGNKVLREKCSQGEAYYIQDNDDAFHKTKYETALNVINATSGMLFFLGVVFVILSALNIEY